MPRDQTDQFNRDGNWFAHFYGFTSKEIGKQLNISPRTFDHHRVSLLRKYEVRATSDLIAPLLA